MRNRMLELVVGIFMVGGFLALAFLALQVSGLSPKSAAETYTVLARFNDIGGLSVRGQVSLAGVTVGRVSDIRLDEETLQAVVEMEIYEDIDTISNDSIAVIRTAGLLGEKYIDISVGGELEYMQEGDYFYGTQSALNIEKLISSFASGGGGS